MAVWVGRWGRGASLLCGGKLHEVCLDEGIEVAVHHTAYVRCLMVGAVVFNSAVVKHIASYLRSPFDLHLSGFDLGLFLEAELEFLVVEYGSELTQGVLFVLGLIACFGVFDEDLFLFAGMGVSELIAETYT